MNASKLKTFMGMFTGTLTWVVTRERLRQWDTSTPPLYRGVSVTVRA